MYDNCRIVKHIMKKVEFTKQEIKVLQRQR